MFDIGWSEMLLVGVIALLVFGPEDIPNIMYQAGKLMRRFRYMRYALSSQFEDFMEKAETSGKVDTRPNPKTPVRDTHEFDETDADEHLMDLLPPPDKDIPEIAVNIPDEPANDGPAPKPDTAANRG
ncbi:MAG: twin-arginine translocase TatA/TatE family subunit [Alphaproteobacteria bacterium]|nr:twin-arginine translocase TatA/TatE family subunit [Alphaproteobacteria bacterium]